MSKLDDVIADCLKYPEPAEFKSAEIRVAAYEELSAEQGRALYAAYVKRGLEIEALRSIQDKNNTPLNSGDRNGRQDSGGEAMPVAHSTNAGRATGALDETLVATPGAGAGAMVPSVGRPNDDRGQVVSSGFPVTQTVTAKPDREHRIAMGEGYSAAYVEARKHMWPEAHIRHAVSKAYRDGYMQAHIDRDEESRPDRSKDG